MLSKAPATTVARLGIVVHPTRSVKRPIEAIHEWAQRHGAQIVQVQAPCEQLPVATLGRASDCDLIVAIGGDGTTLAAIRAGAAADRPVLGVACGSLGVLTTVDPDGIAGAIDRFGAGEWTPRRLPGLVITRAEGPDLVAFNDLVVIRSGAGQLRLTAYLDGELFARIAGDGAIVSTPLGSTAYSLSAGGPLLTNGIEAFLLTPLPAQGGCFPPLLAGTQSELRLMTEVAYSGWRLEIDGQVADAVASGGSDSITVTMRSGAAVLVELDGQERLLEGLRRRRLIVDSPRIAAHDASGSIRPAVR
ncbi:MAG: NAD(+)/NADH kinase [Actinomycetota bacterium]|nr:NAD(+)/NADH kinase [Actinomycetota bacterium]